MRARVVAHQVAARRDLARQRGVRARPAADEEEARRHVVSLQQIQ
jgi:hypothetical protein